MSSHWSEVELRALASRCKRFARFVELRERGKAVPDSIIGLEMELLKRSLISLGVAVEGELRRTISIGGPTIEPVEDISGTANLLEE